MLEVALSEGHGGTSVHGRHSAAAACLKCRSLPCSCGWSWRPPFCGAPHPGCPRRCRFRDNRSCPSTAITVVLERSLALLAESTAICTRLHEACTGRSSGCYLANGDGHPTTGSSAACNAVCHVNYAKKTELTLKLKLVLISGVITGALDRAHTNHGVTFVCVLPGFSVRGCSAQVNNSAIQPRKSGGRLSNHCTKVPCASYKPTIGVDYIDGHKCAMSHATRAPPREILLFRSIPAQLDIRLTGTFAHPNTPHFKHISEQAPMGRWALAFTNTSPITPGAYPVTNQYNHNGDPECQHYRPKLLPFARVLPQKR